MTTEAPKIKTRLTAIRALCARGMEDPGSYWPFEEIDEEAKAAIAAIDVVMTNAAPFLDGIGIPPGDTAERLVAAVVKLAQWYPLCDPEMGAALDAIGIPQAETVAQRVIVALERLAELHENGKSTEPDRWRAWAENTYERAHDDGRSAAGLSDAELRMWIAGTVNDATSWKLTATALATAAAADGSRSAALQARAEADTNRRRWVEAATIANEERARRHAAEASPHARVFADIAAERERQDAKWGPVRKQPNVDPELAARGADHDEIAAAHFIPTAELAKRRFEELRRLGRVSFTDIVVEELSEAVEVHDDPVRLREELVQTAASVVKWIEALDLPGAST